MKSMLPQKSPVSALAYNTGTHKWVSVGGWESLKMLQFNVVFSAFEK